MSETEIQVREVSAPLAHRHELTVDELQAQMGKIHDVMKRVMQEGSDYGVIPGTNKPTLLKPGAEKLNLLFRLDPQYESVEIAEGPHLTIKSTCTLYHIPTGQRLGSGQGSCSTRESKYAYRKGARVCPECGKDTIIKGKAEYGGGWLCFAKKGGCGAKWPDGAAAIEGQSVDRVINDDLPDQYNTVLKMSNKRSLVAAVLNVTAASAIFTQDIEDMDENTRAAMAEREHVGASATPAAATPSAPHATNGASTPPAGQDVRVISEPQRNRLWAIARGSEWSDDEVKEFLSAGGYKPGGEDIPRAKYEAIVDTIKKGQRRSA